MCAGRAELESLKTLQGKRKTKVLMRESLEHHKRMKESTDLNLVKLRPQKNFGLQIAAMASLTNSAYCLYKQTSKDGSLPASQSEFQPTAPGIKILSKFYPNPL